MAETKQEDFVRAVGPVLPGYRMTHQEWLGAAITLRMAAGSATGYGDFAVLLVDLARACDAMHNRLRGATVYAGKAELDAALGPVEP